jgi:hypothetical protein
MAKTKSSTGGESSLRTLVAELKKESNDNGELIVASNFILSNISDNIADLTTHMLKMPIIMAAGAMGSNLSALESKAEDTKLKADDAKRDEIVISSLDKQLNELKELRKDLKKGGLLDFLLAAGALVAGAVVGLVKQYIDVFKKVFKPLLSLFQTDGKGWTALVDKLKDGWKAFTGLFTKLDQFLAKGIKPFVTFFENIGKVFVEAFMGLKQVFGSKEGGIVNSIVNFFKDIGGKFKYFFKLGMVIGQKILFPIITIYDTIMGALDGFKQDGILGGIKGAIAGFVNSIFGGILDLLKDGVSWILNALGFENASKALDSFSFQDIIKEAVSGVVDMFMTPIRVIQDLMKAFSGEVDWGTAFKSVMARIVTGVLAPFNGIAKTFGIDITQKVLDLLGLPKPEAAGSSNGGKMAVSPTSETGVATKALEKTTNENVAVKDEGAAKALASSAAALTNNSSSQVINNNTTQAAIIKTKTTNWEPDDQWARGMAYGA